MQLCHLLFRLIHPWDLYCSCCVLFVVTIFNLCFEFSEEASGSFVSFVTWQVHITREGQAHLLKGFTLLSYEGTQCLNHQTWPVAVLNHSLLLGRLVLHFIDASRIHQHLWLLFSQATLHVFLCRLKLLLIFFLHLQCSLTFFKQHIWRSLLHGLKPLCLLRHPHFLGW